MTEPVELTPWDAFTILSCTAFLLSVLVGAAALGALARGWWRLRGDLQ